MVDITQLAEKLIALVQNQNEKIADLTSRVEFLESKRATTDASEAYVRYAKSSKHNRLVTGDPTHIALACHYYFVKKVPAIRIANSGLMSVSKMQGLSQWDSQHLQDYCLVHGVDDVYKYGLSDAQTKELIPHLNEITDYLNEN